MLIVYDSLTGNVKRFVLKTGMKNIQIVPDLIVNEPFLLVTYTIGFGEVPSSTLDFLEKNSKQLIAVASSGNKNWGDNFARSSEVISEKYNVPVLHKFELSGNQDDVDYFIQEAQRIANKYPEIH